MNQEETNREEIMKVTRDLNRSLTRNFEVEEAHPKAKARYLMGVFQEMTETL